MQSKINHFTILSENNYALGRFYEGLFQMRPCGANGATGAVRVGDGHLGLNIKPRLPGLRAQLDHFGIEVDDVELAIARMKEGYPAIECLERRGEGHLKSLSTHRRQCLRPVPGGHENLQGFL